MKIFLAFEYSSTPSTTTGTPNIKTGALSIAGNLMIFQSEIARNEWVELGDNTCEMNGGNCRIIVSSVVARSLHLGMSVEQYKQDVLGIY